MMRTLLLFGAMALWVLAACGKPDPGIQDAGIDDSCGIDCEAQERFGLIAGRCFEYTDTQVAQDQPAVGAWVRPVRELEGGVKVMPVEYFHSGVLRTEDLFMVSGSELRLARRVWRSTAESVSYLDAEGGIIGVTWWQGDARPGVTFESSAVAEVLRAGSRQSEQTSFTVVALEPTGSERVVPQGAFPEAVKLLFNETPAHGMDTRRVFAAQVGFPFFASSFTLSGVPSQEYRLQGIRDVGTVAGGSHACGFAAP